MRSPARLCLAALALCLAGPALTPAARADGIPTVEPRVETPALFDDAAGGNANGDDPAIWVHPTGSGGAW